MKKDTLIAVIIGVIIGGLVALTVIYLPGIISRVFQNKPDINQQLTPTPSVSISTTSLSLELNEPIDNSILFTHQATFKGKTQPSGKKIILVDTDSDSIIINSDDNGNFSANVSLNEGINQISVSVYDESGNSASKTITVFYTPEKL